MSMKFEDLWVKFSTFCLTSSELDKDGNSLASLIYLSVSVTIKMPDPSSVSVTTTIPGALRGYCAPCALFQSVGPILGNVSSFVHEGIPTRHIEPYSAHLRPLLADLRLFRKWKELCCKEHQGICDTLVDLTELPLRLIDVEKRLIVNGCRKVSFVALSYVWGTDTKPCLTQATKSAFRREGSLDENNLPATIYDAFEVTLALGKRYL